VQSYANLYLQNLYFSALLAPVPSRNSPDRRAHRSVKKTHSKLERNLVPALLVFMTLVMFAMVVVAVGIVAGAIQY